MESLLICFFACNTVSTCPLVVLSKNIISKPKIFLMHGANDTIVSPTHLLEAKEFLDKNGLKVRTKLFKNCEHKIPVEGSSLGLSFLKKNLFN